MARTNDTNSATAVKGYVGALAEGGLNNPAHHIVRLVSRSPDSDALRAVWDRLADLKGQDAEVFAAIGGVRSRKAAEALLQPFIDAFGAEKARENLRFATFKRAAKLNDQLQLGELTVSAGDDRSGDTSETLPDAQTIAAARVAFEMVWAISDPPTGRVVSETERKMVRTRAAAR
jgi:hypothetical protein